jgi:hypothetical protein
MNLMGCALPASEVLITILLSSLGTQSQSIVTLNYSETVRSIVIHLKRGSVWLLLLAVILAPAIFNRSPFMYPDSVGYFHAGEAAIHSLSHVLGSERTLGQIDHNLERERRDGVSTARSVYYGLAYVICQKLAGNWALPIAQSILALLCIWLMIRPCTYLSISEKFLVMIAIISASNLSVFATALMPDVFEGFMLLSVAVLVSYPRLPRWQHGFWLTVAFLGCIFHKGHLATLILCLASAFTIKAWLGSRTRPIIELAVIAAVAFTLFFSVDAAIYRITGSRPDQTPFLLARMVGDGTVEPVLRQECNYRHFAICQYLAEMPMSENDFLWSRQPGKSVMGVASREAREAIGSQQNTVLVEVLRHNTFGQIAASISNFARQFVLVGINEYRLMPTDQINPAKALKPILAAYRSSRVAEGSMPLGLLSAIQKVAYWGSLIGLLVGFLLHRELLKRPTAEVRVCVVLLLGMLCNALVYGVVSGVFDRYQGSVSWLASASLVYWWQATNIYKSAKASSTIGLAQQSSDQ